MWRVKTKSHLHGPRITKRPGEYYTLFFLFLFLSLFHLTILKFFKNDESCDTLILLFELIPFIFFNLKLYFFCLFDIILLLFMRIFIMLFFFIRLFFGADKNLKHNIKWSDSTYIIYFNFLFTPDYVNIDTISIQFNLILYSN